jgi:hypothetical protein|tara:strand:+ start:820 stop:1581 length:762 start_codon:yes stop_codon:yes gene_type:complete
MSKTKEIKAPQWEIKTRVYYLLHSITPLTFTLQTKHSTQYPLLHFDKNTNTQRELRYATNQNSPFVDEQKGECTLGHVIFEDGVLTVGESQQNLQKFLHHHPKKENIFKEWDQKEVAQDDLADLDAELEAMTAAKNMELDHAEAVLRVEKGSEVASLSSKELRRDLLLMAKKNPGAFLSIANDENVGLRNTAIRAVEQHIVKLSQDQRTFHWGSNDRKLLTVPFDENPYSAMAAWFKTDEGVEVFKTIEKKLQ